jgi:hypothetical protein
MNTEQKLSPEQRINEQFYKHIENLYQIYKKNSPLTKQFNELSITNQDDILAKLNRLGYRDIAAINELYEDDEQLDKVIRIITDFLTEGHNSEFIINHFEDGGAKSLKPYPNVQRPKKPGFFSRLFGKKPKPVSSSNSLTPTLSNSFTRKHSKVSAILPPIRGGSISFRAKRHHTKKRRSSSMSRKHRNISSRVRK